MFKQIIPTFEVANEYVNEYAKEIIKQERVERCNLSCCEGDGCEKGGGGDGCG